MHKPPKAWVDWFLENEGRGLLGLVCEPNFQVKDVIPNWKWDGHFWSYVRYISTSGIRS